MWTFAIKQKMTAAALLFAVIVLVMLTNMREQRAAARISTAVTSLYEDRLVVAQYILQLSTQLDRMISDIEQGNPDVPAAIDDYLSEVQRLNALYEKTRLTEMERVNFERFKKLCQNIAENSMSGDRTTLLVTARAAGDTLQSLSSIQVKEGKNKLDEVLNMTYFSNLFSYLELAILIIIAIIIQALVFASKTIRSIKNTRPENLN
ncbi:MCP four helix bundle domain-containing protein [Sphingobacterium sp. JB170]|uniref:MCP four helix bundle domain-containing protein n=1 Tax=Sphingobacterium sp. JB170 TaxID=1434842 RepID=UPI000B35F315|nr:MCP four helix bundle domain-containing protein [Sphingobacterium sp. JB170]